MKFFWRKRHNTSDESESIRREKQDDIIDDAVQAVDIVNASLESGNYSDMSEKLDQLPFGSEITRFVFKSEGVWTEKAKIVICAVAGLFFLASLIISAYVLVFLPDYLIHGVVGTVVSLAIVVLNTVLIIKATQYIKFVTRYAKYSELLRFHSFELTDDIIAYSKEPQKKVIADLDRAVNLKLIPQGHFVADNAAFITSNEAYDSYLCNQSTYDCYIKQTIEERAKMEERSPDVAQIITMGQTYIERLHAISNSKDKKTSEMLSQMEILAHVIFHEIDIYPNRSNKLGVLLNYFLSTLEKLLTTYNDLEKVGLSAVGLVKAKKNIEDSSEKFAVVFERILQKYYQVQEREITRNIVSP